MKIGVLNNEGVQFSTNTFVSSKTKSSAKSKHLTDISQMREQLVNHDKRVKHLDHSQIVALLKRITTFLETSEKTTSKTYIYNSPLELVAV